MDCNIIVPDLSVIDIVFSVFCISVTKILCLIFTCIYLEMDSTI